MTRQSSTTIQKLKAAVRLRDGLRCTRCSVTATDHLENTGRTLDVHRITPGSCYTIDGCVTLCRTCHGSQPRRARGQRLREDPGCRLTVGIPENWHAVLRRIAAKRQQPVLYSLIALVAEEAKRLDIPNVPTPPWESDLPA